MITKCEIPNCKNKAVRYIGARYVCSRCYYRFKYPIKKIPKWMNSIYYHNKKEKTLP